MMTACSRPCVLQTRTCRTVATVLRRRVQEQDSRVHRQPVLEQERRGCASRERTGPDRVRERLHLLGLHPVLGDTVRGRTELPLDPTSQTRTCLYMWSDARQQFITRWAQWQDSEFSPPPRPAHATTSPTCAKALSTQRPICTRVQPHLPRTPLHLLYGRVFYRDLLRPWTKAPTRTESFATTSTCPQTTRTYGSTSPARRDVCRRLEKELQVDSRKNTLPGSLGRARHTGEPHGLWTRKRANRGHQDCRP